MQACHDPGQTHRQSCSNKGADRPPPSRARGCVATGFPVLGPTLRQPSPSTWQGEQQGTRPAPLAPPGDAQLGGSGRETRSSALWGKAKAARGTWLKQTLPSPWHCREREVLVNDSYRNRGEGACGEGQGRQLLPWSCLSLVLSPAQHSDWVPVPAPPSQTGAGASTHHPTALTSLITTFARIPQIKARF